VHEHRLEGEETSKRLLEVLQDLEGLLVQAGEKHWTEAVRYHIRYVVHCPPRDITAAARNILAMYGGMGSFNDMALAGKLEKLHTELWELATKIVRDSREA
jgi:uncharacterized protein DUF6966